MENTPAVSVLLRPLQSEDLKEVVRLHRAAFDYTLNSRLGLEHLKTLYLALLQDPDSTVMVVLKNSIVIGVVSATCDVEKFKSRFKQGLNFGRKLSIAGQMFLHPSLLSQFIEENQPEAPIVYRDKVIQGCLTAIAVDATCRQGGIGRSLVSAVEEFFRRRDHNAFYLMTRAANAISRQFYERLGFLELEQRGKDIVLVKDVSANG